MLDVNPIVDVLQSVEFKRRVATGAIDLGDPLSSTRIDVVRSQLPVALFEQLLPLLQITSGFDIRLPNEVGRYAPVALSLDLSTFHPASWSSTYPLAVEMGFGEEVLYWDLLGDPVGQVFFVDHQGPSHCLVFSALQEMLAFCLTHSVEEYFNELPPCSDNLGEDVAVYRPDTDQLRTFLKYFPSTYTVHDFRNAKVGDWFAYNQSGPNGFVRWGTQRLWVQRQPENWLESMQWWWNPNRAMGNEWREHIP